MKIRSERVLSVLLSLMTALMCLSVPAVNAVQPAVKTAARMTLEVHETNANANSDVKVDIIVKNPAALRSLSNVGLVVEGNITPKSVVSNAGGTCNYTVSGNKISFSASGLGTVGNGGALFTVTYHVNDCALGYYKLNWDITNAVGQLSNGSDYYPMFDYGYIRVVEGNTNQTPITTTTTITRPAAITTTTTTSRRTTTTTTTSTSTTTSIATTTTTTTTTFTVSLPPAPAFSIYPTEINMYPGDSTSIGYNVDSCNSCSVSGDTNYFYVGGIYCPSSSPNSYNGSFDLWCAHGTPAGTYYLTFNVSPMYYIYQPFTRTLKVNVLPEITTSTTPATTTTTPTTTTSASATTTTGYSKMPELSAYSGFGNLSAGGEVILYGEIRNCSGITISANGSPYFNLAKYSFSDGERSYNYVDAGYEYLEEGYYIRLDNENCNYELVISISVPVPDGPYRFTVTAEPMYSGYQPVTSEVEVYIYTPQMVTTQTTTTSTTMTTTTTTTTTTSTTTSTTTTDKPVIVIDQPDQSEVYAGNTIHLYFHTSDGKSVDAIYWMQPSDYSMASMSRDGTVTLNVAGILTITVYGAVNGQQAQGQITLNVAETPKSVTTTAAATTTTSATSATTTASTTTAVPTTTTSASTSTSTSAATTTITTTITLTTTSAATTSSATTSNTTTTIAIASATTSAATTSSAAIPVNTTTAPYNDDYPDDAVITFDFGNYEAKPGDTVKAKVMIKAGQNPVIAMDVVFAQDQTVKLTKIGANSPAFDRAEIQSNIDLPGCNFPSKGDDGNGILADENEAVFNLTYEIPANCPEGEYHIGFGDKCEVYFDNTAWTYKTVAVNGIIRVTAPEQADYTLGDVNNDGIVDGSDATWVLREFGNILGGFGESFTPEQFAAGDVDRNDAIDGSDATLILMYYGEAGKDTEISYGGMELWLEKNFRKNEK